MAGNPLFLFVLEFGKRLPDFGFQVVETVPDQLAPTIDLLGLGFNAGDQLFPEPVNIGFALRDLSRDRGDLLASLCAGHVRHDGPGRFLYPRDECVYFLVVGKQDGGLDVVKCYQFFHGLYPLLS